MVQPLMLLLSSITKDFTYDHPVDIMYMNRSDRTTVFHEADRLGRLAYNEDVIIMGEDIYGNPIVDDGQVIGGTKMVQISQPTQMILTRIREAYKVFKRYSTASNEEDRDSTDLGADSVILRLEGNPRFVYVYVYSIMESKGLEYTTKIRKISEVYNAIVGHSQVSVGGENTQFLLNRFELQSTSQFWCSMLTADIMAHSGGIVSPVTPEDLKVVKKELRDLGFYGFTNPYKMYTEFISSRVNRKLDINVQPEVVEFLRKVVRSGGISVA